MSSGNQGLEEYLKQLHESQKLEYFNTVNCQLAGVDVKMTTKGNGSAPLVKAELALATAIYTQADRAYTRLTGGDNNLGDIRFVDAYAGAMINLQSGYVQAAQARGSISSTEADGQLNRTLKAIKDHLPDKLQTAYDRYDTARQQGNNQVYQQDDAIRTLAARNNNTHDRW